MIFLFFYSCEPEKEVQKSDNDVYGCMDGEAINFLNSATIDDGSCEYLGCKDSEAANFDSAATIDNGNCLEIKFQMVIKYFGTTSLMVTHWTSDIGTLSLCRLGPLMMSYRHIQTAQKIFS